MPGTPLGEMTVYGVIIAVALYIVSQATTHIPEVVGRVHCTCALRTCAAGWASTLETLIIVKCLWALAQNADGGSEYHYYAYATHFLVCMFRWLVAMALRSQDVSFGLAQATHWLTPCLVVIVSHCPMTSMSSASSWSPFPTSQSSTRIKCCECSAIMFTSFIATMSTPKLGYIRLLKMYLYACTYNIT